MTTITVSNIIITTFNITISIIIDTIIFLDLEI